MGLIAAACWSLQVSTVLASAAPVKEQVDALFAEWDSTVTPGCSMAVSKDGRIVQERGYGMANLEHGVPNRADTVFHVASVSKQFTAAAIALLILEGKLSADDPIRKHLPEMPEFDRVITVGHLVHHTSGLRDHSEILELSGWRYYQDLVTTEDAMSVLVKQKALLFEPGSRYNYSNTNYLLMGEIVQRVTGKTLREFAEERIFEPLGMEHSHFRDHFPEVVRGFASGYGVEGGEFVTSLTNFSIAGYSTLLTTVGDLMKWEENFYTGKVGGKAFVDLMQTRVPLSDGKPNKYAYGIVVDEHRGLPSVEHSGGDAGYSSHLVRFPQQHLSVTVLCNVNTADARSLAMRTAEIHLGLGPEAAPKRQPAPVVAVDVSARELQSKVGRYLNSGTEQVINVELRDGKLWSSSGDEQRELTPVARNRYAMSEGRWVLEFPKGTGTPARLTLHDIYHPSQVLDRVPDFQPDTAALAAYAGTYVSEEIEAPFHILVVEGRPMLRSIKFKASLTPVTQNLFAAGWANVAFDRDADGRIAGFRYGSKDRPLAYFTRSSRCANPDSSCGSHGR
jgi:CubicO group peptidase (beta-lactamase class C family)